MSSNPKADENNKKIERSPYHERQRQGLCALHTLNCIFQDGTFTKKDLDNICFELSDKKWFNPHKSYSGFYDVNVIISALRKKSYSLIWFDRRKKISSINFSNVFSFVVNTSTNFKLCWLVLKSYWSHWFSIRQIGDNYYNLDSKLTRPQQVQNITDFLQPYSINPNCHIFLVVSEDVEKEKSWLIDDESTTSD
ncbi:Josephin-1 [Trichoplax sp. H2]|nr:Josephin-1 [Trichoplax sp. H2]|eukprot:RDD45249.1 Josephin-1 [Trichoplax sp. H2]